MICSETCLNDVVLCSMPMIPLQYVKNIDMFILLIEPLSAMEFQTILFLFKELTIEVSKLYFLGTAIALDILTFLFGSNLFRTN